jgi:hypothetical protein
MARIPAASAALVLIAEQAGRARMTARDMQVRAWPQRAGTSAVGADMLTRHQIADAFGTQLVATGSSGRRGWADRMPPAARMIDRMWTCA